MCSILNDAMLIEAPDSGSSSSSCKSKRGADEGSSTIVSASKDEADFSRNSFTPPH